jgi:uncharacterized protein (TIGR03118 family)
MRKIALSSVVALTFAGACGTEPQPTTTSDVSSEVAALRSGPTHRIAALVEQTNIVSDLTTVGAKKVDPNLVNAWGLAFNPKGPAWVSSNGKGLSQVYDPNGNTLLSVTIPPPDGAEPPSAPTGQVFNDDSSSFRGDLFIFATEDGTVAGWQPTDGTTAMLQDQTQVPKGAVFKGLAIGQSHGKRRLYVADFHNDRVVVYNDDYQPIHMHPGQFRDHALPKGFAPFNIVEHDGLLFVTYAKQDADAHDDVKGPGNGFVDVYEPDGDLVQRLISRGVLDSPWGMAFMAAGKKGCKRDRLIVGNFGDGRINVFELGRWGRHFDADLAGALGDKMTGDPLVIDGLWALVFGPGAGGFDADDLYFTAGPNDEGDGIFGELSFD